MTTKPNDFKIGIFVLVGIGLALTAFFIFGASKWFEGKSVEETYVAGNVDGLKVGSPVTLRGVPVGEVSHIDFTWNVYGVSEPRYVYVEFAINNNIPITMQGRDIHQRLKKEVESGLRARIKSQGLAAGTVIISLEYVDPKRYPPLEVPWQPYHDYIPSAPGQMTEIIAGIDSAVRKINQIDFPKIGALLQDDLSAGKRVLTDVDKINLRQIGTNANALIADLRDVAERFKTFAGNTNATSRANLQTIATDAEAIFSRAQQILGRIDQTVGRTDQAIGNVDINVLNDTLENLHRASHELKETINSIKQYPAGAIFGKPPEPARSVERVKQ